MIIKNIVQIGNTLLSQKSKVVKKIDTPEVKRVVKNLVDSLRHHDLIGIASSQIGEKFRIFVTEVRKTSYRNPKDIDKLRAVGTAMQSASLCGLGQTAANPILSTLKYFYDEYIAHIEEKTCPAKKCKELISFHIVEDKCIGCTLCMKKCPANAISGAPKKVHKIDQDLCIKCGECFKACRFDSIIIE